jgi:YD repeat-containing protein
MDRLTDVNQGGQTRKWKYDSLGRMLYERIPEQTATINDGTGAYWTTKYTYTDSNQVATRQDARGVITSYSYDDLHRLTQISYNVSGGARGCFDAGGGLQLRQCRWQPDQGAAAIGERGDAVV